MAGRSDRRLPAWRQTPGRAPANTGRAEQLAAVEEAAAKRRHPANRPAPEPAVETTTTNQALADWRAWKERKDREADQAAWERGRQDAIRGGLKDGRYALNRRQKEAYDLGYATGATGETEGSNE